VNVSIHNTAVDFAVVTIFAVVLVDDLLGGYFRLERLEIRVRRDDDVDDGRDAVEG